MELEKLIIVGVVGFLLAIVSGIAGGGGGFIMTPMLILLGLTPAQSISTGKLAGLSMAVGSLTGMKAKGKFNKSIALFMIILSVVAGIISAKLIVNIDDDIYMKMIGVLLIIIAPLLYIKKIGHSSSKVSSMRKALGWFAVFAFLMLQGVFSSGLGVLINVAMMAGLGMSVIESNITRRITQLVMNSVIVVGVFNSGLIVWSVAFVCIAVNLIGSAIGGHIAVKKGDAFVSHALVIVTIISGIALLV